MASTGSNQRQHSESENHGHHDRQSQEGYLSGLTDDPLSPDPLQTPIPGHRNLIPINPASQIYRAHPYEQPSLDESMTEEKLEQEKERSTPNGVFDSTANPAKSSGHVVMNTDREQQQQPSKVKQMGQQVKQKVKHVMGKESDDSNYKLPQDDLNRASVHECAP